MKTHNKIYNDILRVKLVARDIMNGLFSRHNVDRSVSDPLNLVATLCVASKAVDLLADYEDECGEDCTTLMDISDKLLRMAEMEVIKNRIIENG